MIVAMTLWSLLADAVALFHLAYVAFVVLGLGAIVAGAACGRRWARNFWFRITHLAAMGLVFVETIAGMACPLTVLENTLRLRAGQAGYPADFITYWTHRIVFHDWPPAVFMALYCGFTLAIVATLLIVPPEIPRRRKAHRLNLPP